MSRRCGSRGCAPRVRSLRLAPLTCLSPARRPLRCCRPRRWHLARKTWRSCTGGREGWAAGLYLAALYLREGGTSEEAAASFGGDDRFVSEYMESEFLARISQQQRVFLTRTAMLERMCGPLCDRVLELPGSGATLADLARSNLLLVPLDRRGQWYRYHHLFRDMLLAELERQEPGLIPVLRRRAANWYLCNNLPEEALEYSMAAGDIDPAARLVEQLWLQTDRQGQFPTLQRWLRWLEARGGIEGNLTLATVAAF